MNQYPPTLFQILSALEKSAVRFVLIAFLAVLAQPVVSDAVDTDTIFRRAWQGGVYCGDFGDGSDSYLQEPIAVYYEPSLASAARLEKVNGICIEGGDCRCAVLFEQSVEADTTRVFVAVQSALGDLPFWALVDRADIHDMETLNPDGGNEIEFAPHWDNEIYRLEGNQMVVDDQPRESLWLEAIGAAIPKKIALVSFVSEGGEPEARVWPSHSDESEGRTISGAELSELLRSSQYALLLKREGAYLINGYSGLAETGAVASTGSCIEEEFFWIRPLRHLSLTETAVDDLTDPLFAFVLADPGFEVLESKVINGVSYSLIQQVQGLYDPFTIDPSYEPYLLQRWFKKPPVWVRTYDDQGRVNFWLGTVPC